MMEPNNRKKYNDFINLLLTKEKEPDYQGEEGRLKLIVWINEWTTVLLTGDEETEDESVGPDVLEPPVQPDK